MVDSGCAERCAPDKDMRSCEELPVYVPSGDDTAPHVTTVMRALLVAFAFGVPIDQVPMFGLTSTAPLFGAVLVIAVAWHIVSTGRLRPAPTTLLLLTVFTAWGGASLLWAHDLAPARDRLMTYLQLTLSAWLLWQIVRDERDVRAVLSGYVAGCCVVIGEAWHSFLAGVTYLEQLDQGAQWVDEQRYAAVGFDPNDMGVTLAIGIPIAAFLALNAKGGMRFLWFAYLPLALSAVVLSGSRGGGITAALACCCVLWWIGRRNMTALAAALALIVVGGVTAWAFNPASWERILSARQQFGGGTLGERIPIWRAGIDVLAHHPLTGVGVGSFAEAVIPGLGYAMVAHNTYISVAVEGGAIGALLFFGAFASIVYQVRRSDLMHRSLARTLVLVWLVGVSSLSWEYRKTTWFLLLLGAALARLRPTEARSEPA